MFYIAWIVGGGYRQQSILLYPQAFFLRNKFEYLVKIIHCLNNFEYMVKIIHFCMLA